MNNRREGKSNITMENNSTIISWHETLRLNNEAVVLFNANEISQASRQYLKSLSIARRLMTRIPSSPTKESESIDNLIGHFHVPSSVSSSHHQNSSNGRYFIYPHALVFHEANATTTETLTVYCAGLLFSNALLHHQFALVNGRSRSMFKAEQLYEASLQLLSGLELSPFNATAVVIAIAATNNLAQIQLEKGMLPEASQKFRFIVSMFHWVGMAQCEMFTTGEVQGFLANSLMAGGLAASPAA